MLIDCPYCRAKIQSKLPKPGKYKPKCPKCGESFALVVHDDPEQTFLVRKAEPSQNPEATQAVGSPEATGDFSAREDATQQEVTGAYHAPKAKLDSTNVDATGAYGGDFGGATEATGGYIPNKPEDLDQTADLSEAAQQNESRTDVGTEANKPKKKPAPAGVQQIEMPEQLGGYELDKQLGAGGMGAVYLARQMSLDRSVALKVMHANWAKDPVFLARFTREAYAAAQLNHHNVVQIYDIGADQGINFFSMEFVEGKSLGDVLKKATKFDPNVAVGYIIQAARGLKYAHDRGMVHRDIKPDNLMLNVEGIIKVADLGLVKTSGMTARDDQAPAGAGPEGSMVRGNSKLQSVSVDVTNVGTAMGSPSYMAPEQCRDASTVDPRADIYSLGCTLFAMLAGRTPFQGKTAVEVITKHLSEAPPTLDSLDKSIPKELSSIVGKALAKEPSERYQTMEDFISALRDWQETSKLGPPRPTEEQITLFENLTSQLTDYSLAKLSTMLAVLLPIIALVAGIAILFIKPVVGGALVLTAVSGVLTGIVASGVVSGSFLFGKLREWAFGARITDWLTVALAVVLFLVGLYFSGLIVGGIIGLVLGVVLGCGFAFGIARTVANKREQSRNDFNAVLKRLRLAGMDEDAVRDFVVVTAGDDWEQVYETIYGYPAKLAKRADLAEKGESKPKFAGWRDGLIAKLEGIIESRKQAKAQKHIQKLEQKRLVAEGMSEAEARSQSQDAAEELVEQAAEIKATNLDKKKKVDVKKLMTRYDITKMKEARRPRRSPLKMLKNRVMGAVFSPKLRVVIGAMLIVGGLMWAKQNQAALSQVEAVAAGSTGVESAKQAKQQALSFLEVLSSSKTQPLKVSFLPEALTGIFDSFNPIIAGVVLILSAFTANTFAILAMLIASVLALIGHRFGIIPDVPPLKASHLTAIVGLVLGLGALVILGRREE
ncbi:MAG: protein kinase domain-containing protein [Fimbriiglobus sp.]